MCLPVINNHPLTSHVGGLLLSASDLALTEQNSLRKLKVSLGKLHGFSGELLGFAAALTPFDNGTARAFCCIYPLLLPWQGGGEAGGGPHRWRVRMVLQFPLEQFGSLWCKLTTGKGFWWVSTISEPGSCQGVRQVWSLLLKVCSLPIRLSFEHCILSFFPFYLNLVHLE